MEKYSKSNKQHNGNKAIKNIRLGNIQVAVWANETEFGEKHSVTIERIYRDGDEWKSSYSFGIADIVLIQKTLSIAFEWIRKQEESVNR